MQNILVETPAPSPFFVNLVSLSKCYFVMRFSFFGHQIVPSCSWNVWDRCIWLMQLDCNITFSMSVVVLCLKCKCGNGGSHGFEGSYCPLVDCDVTRRLSLHEWLLSLRDRTTLAGLWKEGLRMVWGIRTVAYPLLLLLQLLRPLNTPAMCPRVNEEEPSFPGTHRPSEQPPPYCQIAPSPAWIDEKV